MTIRPEIDDVVAYLNQLLELDPDFIAALIAARVPCNAAITLHPTVQAGLVDGQYVAGFLGVMNGFLGAYADGDSAGWGALVAGYDDAGRIVRFAKVGS